MSGTSNDKKLLDEMKRAAGKTMTEEEVREQTISFIMGTFKKSSSITREDIEAELDKMAGRKVGKE